MAELDHQGRETPPPRKWDGKGRRGGRPQYLANRVSAEGQYISVSQGCSSTRTAWRLLSRKQGSWGAGVCDSPAPTGPC